MRAGELSPIEVRVNLTAESVVHPIRSTGSKASALWQAPDEFAIHAGRGKRLGARDLAGKSDYEVFRLMVDGRVDAAVGLHQVSEVGQGWPIRTPSGFIVACDANESATGVAGTFDGWNGVTPLNVNNGVKWVEIRASVSAQEPVHYKLVTSHGEYREDPWSRQYGSDDYGRYSMVGSQGPRMERFPFVTDGVLTPVNVHVRVTGEQPRKHVYVFDQQDHDRWGLPAVIPNDYALIGIETEKDRFDLLAPCTDVFRDENGLPVERGGSGARFSRMMSTRVVSMVERRYGEAPNGDRYLWGMSLGGVQVIESLAQQTNGADPIWCGFIADSATLAYGAMGTEPLPGEEPWPRVPWFERIQSLPPPKGAWLYLSHGGSASRPRDNYGPVRGFEKRLREDFHWKANEHFVYHHEYEAEHDGRAWVARAWRVLDLIEKGPPEARLPIAPKIRTKQRFCQRHVPRGVGTGVRMVG